ncbi:MAG: DUF3761 domain-containing protein [Ramlibacter sp.]
MRAVYCVLLSSAVMLSGASALAQKLPTDAPAGTTVQCKDGSFESPESRSGACSGHKGIKTWFGKGVDKSADKSSDKSMGKATDKTSTKSPDKGSDKASASPSAVQTQSSEVRKTEVGTSTGTASKAPATQDASKTTAAAGGAAGKVWVNEDSKVYHCMGDRYYGKTKKGEYMSEREAAAKGARPANKKTCAGA